MFFGRAAKRAGQAHVLRGRSQARRPGRPGPCSSGAQPSASARPMLLGGAAKRVGQVGQAHVLRGRSRARRPGTCSSGTQPSASARP
eukprot:9031149-Alexandrium_andersonii.AAC.1